MCINCYEEYGSPKPNAAAMRLVPLIAAVYEEHAAGGNLHVTIDDWNLEIVEPWDGNPDRPPTEAEARLSSELKKCTIEERAAGLAVYDGFCAPLDESN